MPAARITEFMIALHQRFIADGCSETTAAQYLRTLTKFNNDLSFSNLNFLKNVEQVDALNSGYAESTQRANYATFIAALRSVSEKPTYRRAYNHYTVQFNRAVEAKKAEDTTVKTERESKEWLTWDEILRIHKALYDKVMGYSTYKTLTIMQYQDLLHLVVLSLYTLIPPRRNLDYCEMYIVQKWDESMDKSKNYYCVSSNRFIFNVYKTSKTYSTQIIEIPAPLQEILHFYLRHHSLLGGKLTAKGEARFLVQHDGSRLPAVNTITRILNKIFAKRVGCTMLRHIYLSSKYNIDEMTKDAEAMGHSVAQQRSYMRAENEVIEPPE